MQLRKTMINIVIGAGGVDHVNLPGATLEEFRAAKNLLAYLEPEIAAINEKMKKKIGTDVPVESLQTPE